MIRLHAAALTPAAAAFLQQQQQAIDALPGYAARVAEARRRWDQKTNTLAGQHALDELRAQLAALTPQVRCHYCEDSCADEVEHFRPKTLYPDGAFVWDNHLYACGPCNGTHKRDRWSVLDASDNLIDVTRPRNAPIAPPQAGDDALINPRLEDPLDFLTLDLGTGELSARTPPLSARHDQRARHTIDALQLNRSLLSTGRRCAWQRNCAALLSYLESRTAPAPILPTTAALTRETMLASYAAVWAHMRAQATTHPLLRDLFDLAPEALRW